MAIDKIPDVAKAEKRLKKAVDEVKARPWSIAAHEEVERAKDKLSEAIAANDIAQHQLSLEGIGDE